MPLNCRSKFSAARTRETAQSFAELGMLHRQHGNHIEAQRCLRRALDIHREASGLDSHEATEGLYHLAASLEESGDLDGAASEFERLLALRARQVGVNPLDNAETEVRLAGLYLRVRAHGASEGTAASRRSACWSAREDSRWRRRSRCWLWSEEQSGRPEEAKRWREVASNLMNASCVCAACS